MTKTGPEFTPTGIAAGDPLQATPAMGPAKPANATIKRRRLVFCAVVLATIAGLIAGMLGLMRYSGVTAVEWVMLAAFALTLPWIAIGFWNSIIGLILDLRLKNPAESMFDAYANHDPDAPITSRVAVVMAVRNESVIDALDRFERIELGLSRTEWAEQFDFHLLSDTSKPEIAAEEERAIAAWRARSPEARIHYRRRAENTGYKSGNVMEFLERCGEDYDFYLPLDADSLMGPSAVLRLVRVMQGAPEIGILQGLIVGTPSRTFFTRAFQFGMRHGMRSYTLGSVWWQADCAPYWGHNALIRAKAFRDHCKLPVIPGRGPLAGHVLSHDQIEAALMRRAGYETRVLPVEDQSFEDNPPSLPDFIKRELRWCNGNFQYLRLLGLKGLKPVSQVQIWLALFMYTTSVSWYVFLGLSAFWASGHQLGEVPIAQGLGFFLVIMALNLMPKMMGLAQVLVSNRQSRRYGGRMRVIAGGLCEIVFSMIIAPAVAFSVLLFVIGLLFGKRMSWDAQQRDRSRLAWSEATRSLWPQTLAGVAFFGYLLITAPWALLFALPVVVSLFGAIPIAVLSTHPALGAWSRRIGLFDIPEDRAAQEIAFEPLDPSAEVAGIERAPI